MSAEQVQAALIRLIHEPDHFRGAEIETFLGRYELTEPERWQLRSLAGNFYVSKFGRAQRKWRQINCLRPTFPITCAVLETLGVLDPLYGLEFEPAYPNALIYEISESFQKFFLEKEEHLRERFKLPPFLRDLVMFEYAENTINRNEVLLDWEVPEQSLLSSKIPFALVSLNYDIPAYVERVRARDLKNPTENPPLKSKSIILFVKIPVEGKVDTYLAQQFAIDDQLKRFLEEERQGKRHLRPDLPPCYDELVGLGMCKPYPECDRVN